jgi:hypothetical protein
MVEDPDGTAVTLLSVFWAGRGPRPGGRRGDRAPETGEGEVGPGRPPRMDPGPCPYSQPGVLTRRSRVPLRSRHRLPAPGLEGPVGSPTGGAHHLRAVGGGCGAPRSRQGRGRRRCCQSRGLPHPLPPCGPGFRRAGRLPMGGGAQARHAGVGEGRGCGLGLDPRKGTTPRNHGRGIPPVPSLMPHPAGEASASPHRARPGCPA